MALISPAHRPGPGDSDSALELSVAATPESAYSFRLRFTQWLDAAVSVDAERRSDIILAVYEAVANAAEHAYAAQETPGSIGVRARGTSAGELEVAVTDTGTWKPGHSDQFRGRGLALLTALSDDSEVTTGPSGTAVTLRWQLVRDGARV
jgi:serine/threonine-protein kinase RsbW